MDAIQELVKIADALIARFSGPERHLLIGAAQGKSDQDLVAQTGLEPSTAGRRREIVLERAKRCAAKLLEGRDSTLLHGDVGFICDFDRQLQRIATMLRSGGPPVDLTLLASYIDKKLDEQGRRQVECHAGTWRAWYDAFWETLAAARRPDIWLVPADVFESPWRLFPGSSGMLPNYTWAFANGLMRVGFHLGARAISEIRVDDNRSLANLGFDYGGRETLWSDQDPLRWFLFNIANDGLRIRWGRTPGDLHSTFECEFCCGNEALLLLSSEERELTVEIEDLWQANRLGCDRVRWRAFKVMSG